MKQVFFFILFLAAVGALSLCAWISLQSLIQARLLLRIRSLARRSHFPAGPAGPAAMWGILRVVVPLRERGLAGNVWYRRTTQVFQGRRRRRGWETVSDTVQAAVFTVESQGREFRVEEAPTEVQGFRSNTEYSGARLFGVFTRHGDQRVIHRWLPIGPWLTVAGRLEGGKLVKDNKVGLLISPHEPDRAALIEFAKGAAGLLGVTLAVAAGLMAYYSGRWGN